MDLSALPPDLLFAAVALLFLLAVAQTLRLAWHRGAKRRQMARARERGAAGELRAEELLARRGYRILGRQVAKRYGVGVDGHLVDVDLRADYLVSRERRRYVAEVKTGRLAPRIDTPATRRQLLEYRMAFDVDGVLLVDAESDRVHRIVFPLPAGATGSTVASRLTWLMVGVMAGAGAVLALRGGAR